MTKLAIMAIAAFGLLFMPFSYRAGNFLAAEGASSTTTQLNDLYQKKTTTAQDIAAKAKAAADKKKQADDLAKKIKEIDGNISQAQAKINSLQDQINQTQKEIEDTQNQIQQKETELVKETNDKHDIIRAIYETGDLNTLELLISSSTLSEFINSNQYFEALENKVTSTIDEINRLKSELESKKTELNKKNSELEQYKIQEEAYNQGLKGQKQEKGIILNDTKSQQRTLEQQVAEAKKYSKQVEAQIASLQASLNQSSGRTVLARDRGTSAVGFSWPADYKYLTAYYGDLTPFQNFHSGIDLANIPGTPIFAAADGTVVTATSMMMNGAYYGYGNYIVIGHNAKYSSLYGHLMSFAVSAGTEVKKGDVIGYMGTTGWSTGPHLHFEVWENGARQNPLNYLP